MGNTLWKPMPGYSGYEINRKGWVRNLRGYVVASGRGICLSVEGVKVSLPRKRLVELAAEVFDTAEPLVPAPEPILEPASPNVEAPEPEPAPKPKKKRQNKTCPRSRREPGDKGEMRINPTRILLLNDPWANGTIGASSHWDLAGVM